MSNLRICPDPKTKSIINVVTLNDDLGTDGVGPNDSNYEGPDLNLTECNNQPDCVEGIGCEPNFGETDVKNTPQMAPSVTKIIKHIILSMYSSKWEHQQINQIFIQNPPKCNLGHVW